MTPIYLIRHARPAAAWDGGDTDPGLNAMGRAQAAAAAERLLALAPELRPRRIVSSPLRRCRETAAALSGPLAMTVEIDEALGEIPTPRALAAADRSAWLARALSGRWGEIDGDIDYEDWRRRVHAAVARYPGAAIFSHFFALNAVVSILRGSDAVVGFRPDHASITSLNSSSPGLNLARLGDEAATGVL